MIAVLFAAGAGPATHRLDRLDLGVDMLIDRINDDMKTAMKARDSQRLSVLRMALSELKNARIAKGGDLTEDEALQVIRRGVKQREESAVQYRDGGRADLADAETSEAAILTGYLPQQVTGDALEALVAAKIAELGASSMKEMGGVIKAIMSEHGATVDGKAVSALVKAKLGG